MALAMAERPGGGRAARVVRGSLTYRLKSEKRESAFAKAMARQERKAGNGAEAVGMSLAEFK